jgi:hypothetical protein
LSLAFGHCDAAFGDGSRFVDVSPLRVGERYDIERVWRILDSELLVMLRALCGTPVGCAPVSESRRDFRESGMGASGRERDTVFIGMHKGELEFGSRLVKATKSKQGEPEDEVRTLELWNPHPLCALRTHACERLVEQAVRELSGAHLDMDSIDEREQGKRLVATPRRGIVCLVDVGERRPASGFDELRAEQHVDACSARIVAADLAKRSLREFNRGLMVVPTKVGKVQEQFGAQRTGRNLIDERLEKLSRAAEVAGCGVAEAGLVQPPPTSLAILGRCVLCGEFRQLGRGRRRPSQRRAPSGLVERICDLGIGMITRSGEMAGPFLRLDDDSGELPVQLSASARRDRRRNCGRKEWMPETDAFAFLFDQAACHGEVE